MTSTPGARTRCLLAASLLLAPDGARSQDITQPVVAAASLTGEARRLDSLGLEAWRRYESLEHGATVRNMKDVSGIPMPRSSNGTPFYLDAQQIALVEGGLESMPRHRQAKGLRDLAVHFKPEPGLPAYSDALSFFRSAQQVAPDNVELRRHVYRALAARQDWPGLLAEAARGVRANPVDASAWLARGLALQRQQDYQGAAVAFDNAMRNMSTAEQASFESLERLLTPRSFTRRSRYPDSVTFAGMSDAEKQRWRATFWNLADPRPGTRINEALLEFHARVAYADIRWTNETGNRGANSDRGDIHIRYGPPETIYALGRGLIWVYPDESIFYFGRSIGYYGTRIANAERGVVEDSIKVERPMSWDNMPLVRNSWPMLMRVARFRSTADSMDAVVTAAVPVRSFLGDVELSGRFPIDVTLAINDPAARMVGLEKRRVEVARDSLPVGINGAWVRRIGRGLNVVRVDATQDDVGRAALSSLDVVADTTRGFGMSDLLLGTTPRVDGTSAPARWHDVSIAPTVGVFPFAQPIGFVWEAYELAQKDGTVKYTVTLELERTFTNNLKGFVARIRGNVLNLVRQDGSGTGRITVGYPQSRAASPIVTDYLAVDLNGSVPGTYRATIVIRDEHSGLTTRRSADFTLTRD